jgi:hypothetical protein
VAVPEPKVFKPKFPDLPVLEDYKVITDEKFWDVFPRNFVQPAKSNIDAAGLARCAKQAGVGLSPHVAKVIDWVANGAEIGCKGVFRAASHSKNAKNAYVNGRQVSDAIAAWVNLGYAYGPVLEEDVPAHAKVNGILTRTKPNGSVRIILNLSAPKGFSVNDGINNDDFPATMSSTEAWLRVLNAQGKGCNIMKVDFADAYKHIPVKLQDTDLQWFEWGGRYFKELCLIFGASSSAGIFDATAKVFLQIVCAITKFPRQQICQHLDDICAAAADGDRSLWELDAQFQATAAEIGVKLASRDDPDKSFAPCKRGVVFGVDYDTDNWCWSIPDEKRARLIVTLKEAVAADEITARQAKSIVGKLIHIKALLPAAKYNICHIMRLGAAAAPDADLDATWVPLDPQCKRQLWHWILLLQACPGWITIPNDSRPMPWAAQVFTDAAGGSLDRLGAGIGGVCGTWWFYIPWPKVVNAGGWRIDGKKVGRKLSALELIGPLVAVAAGHKQFANSHVTVWVDNAGSVAIWEKGYSTKCRLSSTIVTTTHAIAAAIGCTLHIKKIRRCSNSMASAADALSKAQFRAARGFTQLDIEPATVPVTLLKWISQPNPSDDLAHIILQEISKTSPVLNYSV